ncbi:hypothetical protein ISF_09276 [Cordyceps fumosorosea ARSEF 2679]|uniref:Uncharacterized protein n=1 Tax=Cordyceps fumosorosea (strain ARSEF 2679) TaxID=1081104 RepID=A0A167LBL8_CORFA|nr:hypothetical protein ISF_09276 [Cordyceps fumosorosea ARSEF 2679]OAA52893.1 hypothetical protein ISF_09276 [Cordyceps fumosorosea ARSEF 2679]
MPLLFTDPPSSPPPRPRTTPFVVPGSCTGNFNSTTTVSGTLMYIIDTAPDEAACNHGQTPTRTTDIDLALTFSPGVCPSAWTAYHLQIATTGSGKSRQSSAWCCPSGFLPSSRSGGKACAQTVAANTSSSGYDFYPAATTTQRLATPWIVTWAASDTRTMSPRPPILAGSCTDAEIAGSCTDAEIATWTPGATVLPADRWCHADSSRDSDLGLLGSPLFWFLVVGVPLIVIGVPSIVCCCVCPGITRRKRLAREAQMQAQARAALVPAPTEVVVPPPGLAKVREG